MSLILTPGGHFITDFGLHPLLGSDSLATTSKGEAFVPNERAGRSRSKVMADDSQPVPENITVGKWDPEIWKSRSPDEAIHSLFAYVDTEASKAVAWYENAKGSKATSSRVFRGFAIVLFVLGGLAPIAAGIMSKATADAEMVVITQSGYMMLGIAAGLLAFDRYFGVSSGWIRYMTSLAAIERLRAEFLFDWTALLQKAPATIDSETKLVFLTRAQAFQKGVSEIVERDCSVGRRVPILDCGS